MAVSLEQIKSNILEKEPKISRMLEMADEGVDLFDYPKVMEIVEAGLSIGDGLLKENVLSAMKNLNTVNEEWSKYEKSATAENEGDPYRRLVIDYYRPIIKSLLKSYSLVEINNEALSRMNSNAKKIIKSFESTKIQAKQLDLIKEIKEKEGDRMKEMFDKVLEYKKDENKELMQNKVNTELERQVQNQGEAISKLTTTLQQLLNSQQMMFKSSAIQQPKHQKFVENIPELTEEEGEEVTKVPVQLTENQQHILDFIKNNPDKKLGYYLTVIPSDTDMKSKEVKETIDMLIDEKLIKVKKEGISKILKAK